MTVRLPSGSVPPPPGTFTIQPGYGPYPMQVVPGIYSPSRTVSSPPNMQLGQTAIWMPVPPPMEGVPRGLEYLTMVSEIIIEQMFEVLEIITGFEVENTYILRNRNGEQVYYALEESGFLQRNCCGPERCFTMHIVDNFRREVMRIHRPFVCCGGGCRAVCADASGCASRCTVEAPSGNLIGTVQQRGACCADVVNLKDASGTVILYIDGPCCCLLHGCQDKKFPVKTVRGQVIGSITKKWTGFVYEAYTDADIYSVTFPVDLDVNAKAILLGATFLLDYMEFEDGNKKTKNP